MNKNKILYLSYDGLTDQLSKSQIIPYLNILSNLFSVFVLTCEKKNKLMDYLPIKKHLLEKNKIICKKIYFTKKKYLFIFSKLFDFLKIFILSAIIIKKNHIKIVHCRGHIPAFIIFFLKLFFNVKLIFDYRGMWIEERIDMNVINLSSNKGKIINYLLKKIETKTIRSSHKIIVLTNSMKKFIINKYNINKDDIFVIPCYVNINTFQLRDYKNINIRNELKINSKSKIICYLGSVSGMYLIEEMLDFFVYLKKKSNNYYFLFITNNILELDTILKNKNYNEYKEYIKIKSLEFEQVPKYLSQVNLSICFLKNSIARMGTFPIKFAETLAMGIPQIYNSKIGDFDLIFKNNKIGAIIDITNKSNINKIINDFTTIENLNKTMIQKYALENFSIDKANEKYINVYKKLI